MLSIILFDVVLITEISLASRTFGGEAVISKHSLAPSTSHYCIPYQHHPQAITVFPISTIHKPLLYSLSVLRKEIKFIFKEFFNKQWNKLFKAFLFGVFFLKKNVIILLIKVLERLDQIFILSSGE